MPNQKRRHDESPSRHNRRSKSGHNSRSYSNRKGSSRHRTISSSRSRSISIVNSHRREHSRNSRSPSYRRRNSRSRSRSHHSRYHRSRHYDSRSPKRYRSPERRRSLERKRTSKESSREQRRSKEHRRSKERRRSAERRRSTDRRKEHHRSETINAVEPCQSPIEQESPIRLYSQTPLRPKLDFSNYSSGLCLNENTNEINSSENSNHDLEEDFEKINAVKRENDDASSAAYYDDTSDGIDPIDKERIHREIEEKLRQTLAKEGKIYPPPKAEASHPVFANDGSFLEMFKKMQQAQEQTQTQQTVAPCIVGVGDGVPIAAVPTYTGLPCMMTKPQAPLPPPLVGRRRGGKILKTGLVAKQKAQTNNTDPKDFWTLYLAEVNKYKNNACESDGGTRPLVK